MMKQILLFAFFTLLLQSSFAQDQIVKLNGDEIPARVLEITLQEVLYQHPDSLQGKTWRIPKAEVFMIRFANGTKEVLSQDIQDNQPEELNPEDMYLQGRQDAERYYNGNTVMWGSAAVTLLFPYGYAGVATIALIRPKAHKNLVPNMNLLSDPDYVKGYEDRARGKKAGKAIAGAGIGTAAILTTIVIIFSNTRWH